MTRRAGVHIASQPAIAPGVPATLYPTITTYIDWTGSRAGHDHGSVELLRGERVTLHNLCLLKTPYTL